MKYSIVWGGLDGWGGRLNIYSMSCAVCNKKLMSCIVAESFQRYLIKGEKEEIDKSTTYYLQIRNATRKVRN